MSAIVCHSENIVENSVIFFNQSKSSYAFVFFFMLFQLHFDASCKDNINWVFHEYFLIWWKNKNKTWTKKMYFYLQEICYTLFPPFRIQFYFATQLFLKPNYQIDIFPEWNRISFFFLSHFLCIRLCKLCKSIFLRCKFFLFNINVAIKLLDHFMICWLVCLKCSLRFTLQSRQQKKKEKRLHTERSRNV